ncbi:MAG: hypothetical protein WCQ67_00120 [Treponema sp.]
MNKVNITREEKLIEILKSQDELLDCILKTQGKIHDDVISRNWNELQDNFSEMEAYSNGFVSLDDEREKLIGNDRTIYFASKVEPLFTSVRSKLTQSKIENMALSTYVNTAQSLLANVLDKCVPQQRNTLYTSKGQIQKPVMQSIVINKLF